MKNNHRLIAGDLRKFHFPEIDRLYDVGLYDDVPTGSRSYLKLMGILEIRERHFAKLQSCPNPMAFQAIAVAQITCQNKRVFASAKGLRWEVILTEGRKSRVEKDSKWLTTFGHLVKVGLRYN